MTKVNLIKNIQNPNSLVGKIYEKSNPIMINILKGMNDLEQVCTTKTSHCSNLTPQQCETLKNQFYINGII